MSHSDIGPVPTLVSEQNAGKRTSDSREDDPEHSKQKTNLARLSEIDTRLGFAECTQDVADELLEASLEEYQ